MTFLIPPDRFLWGEGMLLIRAVIVRKVKGGQTPNEL